MRTSVLYYLLRPVVRYCLRTGVAIQELDNTLRQIFVAEAIDDLRSRDEKVNVSRLSIGTGIHRRDISRLLEQKEVGSTEPQQGFVPRLLGQWENDRRFTKKNGSPRVLSFERTGSDFERLVHSISQDLHPGTVLFELERLNLVERTAGGLGLIKAAYTPPDIETKYALLGRDIDSLSAAVEENIQGRSSIPHLHATTEFDNIHRDKLSEVQRWLLKKGTQFHADLRAYLAKFDDDINSRPQGKGGGGRVVVGTFSLCKEEKK